MAKILIVDDSDLVLQEVRRILETTDHVVVEAVNGEDGLEKGKSNPDIALVISDVNMTGMDGTEMVEKLRQVEGLESVVVFLLTTDISAAIQQRAKAVGVKLFIPKPPSEKRLLLAVNKVLGS